jgi:hypothetical protein
MAQHWLINEAASSENINKAGTFRYVVVDYIL